MNYDLNEHYHASVVVPHDLAIESHTSGHLRYERGRGVVKIEEADCRYCEQQGLNDGKWHKFEAQTQGS